MTLQHCVTIIRQTQLEIVIHSQKTTKENKIIFGDVSEDLTTNITKNKDIVVHLAALISIPYSYVSPKSYIDTNIYGTYNILNSCKNNSVKKIIITSTSEVYGTTQYVPMTKTSFKLPISLRSIKSGRRSDCSFF